MPVQYGPPGGYTETPGCFRWLVATQRYTVPTRCDTDHFSKLRILNFFPDMPVYQGSCRMRARCIHSDAGDNTDNPGAIICAAIHECVKAP